MADVFISYKREERAAVERIAKLLGEQGLSIWFDARLPSGQSFDEEINRELHAAKAVLVCWSPSAIASDWVRAEATIGRERNVLVAVMLAPAQLYPPFNLVHAADLTQWTGNEDHPGWLATLARIGALTGRTDLVAKGEAFAAADANAQLKRRKPWGAVLGALAGVVVLGLGGLFMAGQFGAFDPKPSVYSVKFSGPVAGLQPGDRVEFSGVTVGEVAEVRLDPQDPNIIVARLAIDAAAPVRTDSLVDVLMGEGGAEVLRISVGSLEAPLLRTPDEKGRPALLATGQSLPINPPADACVQSRADWGALAQSNDVKLITEFRDAAPETCTIQRALAQSRIDELTAANSANSNAAAQVAQIDRAFAGSWAASPAGAGACGRLPWRFERQGANFQRIDAGGDKDLFVVAGDNPPTLRFAETGLKIVAEGGQLKVLPADGGETCLLVRQ